MVASLLSSLVTTISFFWVESLPCCSLLGAISTEDDEADAANVEVNHDVEYQGFNLYWSSA